MPLRLLAIWALCAPASAEQKDVHRHTGGTHAFSKPSTGLGSGALKSKYPWYHTSREIRDEVLKLTQGCNGALSVETREDDGGQVKLDVVKVKAKNAEPVNRMFIVFGEHSRELISPESGLQLLRVLCGTAPAGSGTPTAEQVLKDSEFAMVLNCNPRSRIQVEDGDFCRRTNPNGVDLNRNWDEEWSGAGLTAVSSPGPRPFSEPETQILRGVITEYMPTTFLTVHSGTRGMYMPWAYDMEHLASRNRPSMLRILRELDRKHCACPYGAAGKEVGYPCPGTSIDYVYDKLSAKYSFAFEIYASRDNDVDLKERWNHKLKSGGESLLKTGHHLGHPHFADLFEEHASDFVHAGGRPRPGLQLLDVDSQADALLGSETAYDEPPSVCFGRFNPETEESFGETVRNWADAYLELAHKVAAEVREKPAAAPIRSAKKAQAGAVVLGGGA